MKLSDAIEAGIKVTGYASGTFITSAKDNQCATCAIGAAGVGLLGIDNAYAYENLLKPVALAYPELERTSKAFIEATGLHEHFFDQLPKHRLANAIFQLSDNFPDGRERVVAALRKIGL